MQEFWQVELTSSKNSCCGACAFVAIVVSFRVFVGTWFPWVSFLLLVSWVFGNTQKEKIFSDIRNVSFVLNVCDCVLSPLRIVFVNLQQLGQIIQQIKRRNEWSISSLLTGPYHSNGRNSLQYQWRTASYPAGKLQRMYRGVCVWNPELHQNVSVSPSRFLSKIFTLIDF